MQDPSGTLDMAISVVTRLRGTLMRRKADRIRSFDDQMLVKAAAQAWFRSHKPNLLSLTSEPLFREIDEGFALLLEYSDQGTAKRKYIELLSPLRLQLVRLRSRSILAPPTQAVQQPDFKQLIKDPLMIAILQRRWTEIMSCLDAGADLAATVMIGGLLEALCLARVNQETDLKPVFTARSAPKDKLGKPRPLKEWGLKDFLDVANELGWIRKSAKDVGAVLRDYRNYIHPEKERSHGISINADDAKMFLAVLSSLAGQIIASVRPLA